MSRQPEASKGRRRTFLHVLNLLLTVAMSASALGTALTVTWPLWPMLDPLGPIPDWFLDLSLAGAPVALLCVTLTLFGLILLMKTVPPSSWIANAHMLEAVEIITRVWWFGRTAMVVGSVVCATATLLFVSGLMTSVPFAELAAAAFLLPALSFGLVAILGGLLRRKARAALNSLAVTPAEGNL